MESVTGKPPRFAARSIGATIFCLLLAAIFAWPLFRLFAYAFATTMHSHVVLVPLISAYLISIDRARLPRPSQPSFVPAVLLAIAGGFALYVANSETLFPLSQNDHFAVVGASFLCFLWAGGFVFLGSEWMWACAFPLFFLVFMIPLPDGLVDALETASKYASADAASAMLNLGGVPMLRHGLILRLPGIALEVAQECSGIRSSWVLFITSLLASYLFLRSSWRRLFLVAFVVPLGVVRNGFRISVIAWLCVHYGPHMVHSIIHRRGGPFFFVLSLIPLFALLWWLRRGENKTVVAEMPAVAAPGASHP